MRQVPLPRDGSSPLAAADHYLKAYQDEFFRTREAVKLRVNIVTWTTTIGSGLIAALGATSAALSDALWPRIIGIAIALVSSVVTAFSGWESLAQHRRHWVQKTRTINSLTRERMWVEQQKAEGADSIVIADHVFATLRHEFESDLEAWLGIHERDTGESEGDAGR